MPGKGKRARNKTTKAAEADAAMTGRRGGAKNGGMLVKRRAQMTENEKEAAANEGSGAPEEHAAGDTDAAEAWPRQGRRG